MCVLFALAACGRLGFDAADDVVRTCGPWRELVTSPFGQVNRKDVVEWGAQVSRDGLHIMYSSDFDDDDDARTDKGSMSIFAAHRQRRTDPFGAPKFLKQVNEKQYAAGDPSLWDEAHELYFVDRHMGTETCVYVAKLDADFQDAVTPPAPIGNLCFPGADYIQGIWISDDGNRLYYETNDKPLDTMGSGRRTWMATRDATGAFPPQPHEEHTELATMGYCTLAADEKTIYCEHAESNTDISLWQATRRSLDAPFSDIQRIPERKTQNHDGDPSVTADGQLMIFAEGLYPDADLVAMERDCTDA